MGEEEVVRFIERELRRRGLTERQVKAGVKYYLNFCRKFDISPTRSVRMIVRMVENMRKRYEEA